MKESILEQYSKIKQEYKLFRELKRKLGLSSSNYLNIEEMEKKLTQSYLDEKNE